MHLSFCIHIYIHFNITMLCYCIVNIMAKVGQQGDKSLHKLGQAGPWSKSTKKKVNLLIKVGDQIIPKILTGWWFEPL